MEPAGGLTDPMPGESEALSWCLGRAGRLAYDLANAPLTGASAKSFDIRNGLIEPLMLASLGGRGCLQPGSRSDKKGFAPRLGRPQSAGLRLQNRGTHGDPSDPRPLAAAPPWLQATTATRRRLPQSSWDEPRTLIQPNPGGADVLAGDTTYWCIRHVVRDSARPAEPPFRTTQDRSRWLGRGSELAGGTTYFAA